MEREERDAFDADLISKPVARTATGSMSPSMAGEDHAAGIAAMMALMGMTHG
jgi:hypothetical protein